MIFEFFVFLSSQRRKVRQISIVFPDSSHRKEGTLAMMDNDPHVAAGWTEVCYQLKVRLVINLSCNGVAHPAPSVTIVVLNKIAQNSFPELLLVLV